MIVIERGALNTFALTLTEKVTIPAPYYLMTVTGKSGQAIVKWLMTDISAYPERFNKFQFTEGVTATIPFKGDYIYKVYQKAAANTIIPTDPNDLIEQGIMRVEGDDATYVEHSNTTTTVIYEAD